MVGTNWRSRPLWEDRSYRVAIPQADVTGFLREGRSSLCQTTRKPGGERHRPATRQTSGAGRKNQPQSRVTPLVPGFRNIGRTQSVNTDSCYCEPVWWSTIRRFWTNRIEAAASFRRRNRKRKKETGRRGLSDPSGRRRETGDDHGDAIRSEDREAPKTGSSD
jgi:hypothetical protein